MTRTPLLVALSCCALAIHAEAVEMSPRKTTVLAGGSSLEVTDALTDGVELLVPVGSVAAITGFELKPEGMCTDQICIPIPSDSGWRLERNGHAYFNVTSFARKMDQVYAVDSDKNVWSFTPVPRAQTTPLMSGMAPEFALPDRSGKIVRLSDFRGKKVLIVTWASWCGCRLDLAGWQDVYDDLKDKNFEIISVAQDTGGLKAAEPWYERGKVTYAALVDVDHTVSSLYQMVNVPMGVWVDESGRIVRPAEVAYSKQMTFVGSPAGDDRYAQGVRDWVNNGPKSAYVTSPQMLKARLQLRSPELRLADAHFKLATYFTGQNDRELAARHFQQAQKLNPDNWNYHRQEWSFEPGTANAKWSAKVRSLNGKPYYEPVEFPSEAASNRP